MNYSRRATKRTSGVKRRRASPPEILRRSQIKLYATANPRSSLCSSQRGFQMEERRRKKRGKNERRGRKKKQTRKELRREREREKESVRSGRRCLSRFSRLACGRRDAFVYFLVHPPTHSLTHALRALRHRSASALLRLI